MVESAQSKDPGGREPIDKVRRLQRKLYAAAKQHSGRRFHALYDRIHRSDVLWEAWGRVRRNRGAAGVDGVTLAAVEGYGAEKMVEELRQDLQAGEYRPQPVLRRYIPKGDGKRRPLGIPTVKDRVAQALETIREAANAGYNHVVDADIRDYFGSIDHELLMERVNRRVSAQAAVGAAEGEVRNATGSRTCGCSSRT